MFGFQFLSSGDKSIIYLFVLADSGGCSSFISPIIEQYKLAECSLFALAENLDHRARYMKVFWCIKRQIGMLWEFQTCYKPNAHWLGSWNAIAQMPSWIWTSESGPNLLSFSVLPSGSEHLDSTSRFPTGLLGDLGKVTLSLFPHL